MRGEQAAGGGCPKGCLEPSLHQLKVYFILFNFVFPKYQVTGGLWRGRGSPIEPNAIRKRTWGERIRQRLPALHSAVFQV